MGKTVEVLLRERPGIIVGAIGGPVVALLTGDCETGTRTTPAPNRDDETGPLDSDTPESEPDD